MKLEIELWELNFLILAVVIKCHCQTSNKRPKLNDIIIIYINCVLGCHNIFFVITLPGKCCTTIICIV